MKRLTSKAVAIGLAILGLFVLLTIAGVLANAERIAIFYHERGMTLAHERAYADPEVGPTGLIMHEVDEDFELFEYHRDQLVARGVLSRIDYKFRHLVVGTTPARSVLNFIIAEKGPPLIDFTSPHRPGTPVEVTIWCRAGQAAAWKNLLATFDSESLPAFDSE